MFELYRLLVEKNRLPEGNIYLKKIKGHFYYYHQYSSLGKKYTKKISEQTALELKKQIEERKQIDREIKEILKKEHHQFVLSSSAYDFTGYVMSGNEVVAKFEGGELLWSDEKKCPFIIKRTGRLEPFLKTRVIDPGRTNARILKKILCIHEEDDSFVSLCSYAASITDNYWFKPLHSKLKYQDICFNNDLFFGVSLKGQVGYYPNRIHLTPELTTVGSYEKGWKNEHGEWWLYKQGTPDEIFSELFYARLFENLGLATAHYEYDDGYIKSRNFSKDDNYEPMVSLVGENEDYAYIFNILKKINLTIANDYLRLCFYDVVLNNIDRHNENCGILRSRKTGKIICLAPNFDNNLSLISRTRDLINGEKEGFLSHFVKELKRHPELKDALKTIELPLMSKEIIEKSFPDMPIEVDKEQIANFVLSRYGYLISFIKKTK